MSSQNSDAVHTDAAEVTRVIGGITDGQIRADARKLVEIMSRETGEPPRLWGDIVGFGRYHYKYPSGRQGESFLAGFAARKAEFSIHLMGIYFPEQEEARQALLAKLGKHRAGKACLYVKRLAGIDDRVLAELVRLSATELQRRYPG